MRLLVLAALAMVMSASRADACACCDAKFRRTPVGWSDTGDAVLVEAFDTVGCEHKRRLEIWPVGATEPSGCYDLYGDPEVKIACADLKFADPPHPIGRVPRQEPKKSTKVKQYPKSPKQLAAAKVRTKKTGTSQNDLEIGVDIAAAGTWKRAWTGTIPSIDRGFSAALWPTPKGDRALLLVKYARTGTGNEQVDVHWIDLPK